MQKKKQKETMRKQKYRNNGRIISMDKNGINNFDTKISSIMQLVPQNNLHKVSKKVSIDGQIEFVNNHNNMYKTSGTPTVIESDN